MTRTKKDREYNKIFGPHIRKMRLERFPDMTVSDFADSVGITGPYLSKIETCKVPPPSDTTVKAIAEKLGEDTDTLLLMAGYVDPDLINSLDAVTPQHDFLKVIRFMRGSQNGPAKFTTEQFIAYLIGRTLEERRKLKTSEILPETLELLGYLNSHDGQFPEDLLPTVDRGLRALEPILRITEEKERDKKAKKDGRKADS